MRKQKFEFTWPGKYESQKEYFIESKKKLIYCDEDSKNPDTTENIYIEGDNLEVLKLLRQNYYGAVKMIYIDPPYNTGKDFIYKDNFRMDKEEHEIEEGDRSELGERYTVNRKDQNRYHTNWLNMMYPRLKVVRDLLTEDGLIFISIDDGEVANLKKICDEIFGEHNFIANVIWQKKYTRANDAKWFSDNHDHILCYGKTKDIIILNMLPRNDKQLSAYSNPDNHSKGVWKATPLHAKSGTNTSIFRFKNGVEWHPPIGTYRRFNDKTMQKMDDGDEIWFGVDRAQTPSRKSFLCEVKDGVVPVTLWPYDEVGHNHEANNELKKINLNGIFNNPKPSRLIKRAITLATDSYDLIIDFFAGSTTTAQAVMQLNAEDNGNRKYIMVQLPEPCPEKSEAFKAGYKNICEIGKERTRRAGDKILEENKDKEGIENLDIGFKVFKLED